MGLKLNTLLWFYYRNKLGAVLVKSEKGFDKCLFYKVFVQTQNALLSFEIA